jgi:hypothetical protein
MGVLSIAAERVVRCNKPAARHASTKDLARRLVEHPLRPEALQPALGAELLRKLQTERDLRTQVEGAAGDRCLVRNGIMRLQKQRDRELRRRDTRASELLAVRRDAVFVSKPLASCRASSA